MTDSTLSYDTEFDDRAAITSAYTCIGDNTYCALTTAEPARRIVLVDVSQIVLLSRGVPITADDDTLITTTTLTLRGGTFYTVLGTLTEIVHELQAAANEAPIASVSVRSRPRRHSHAPGSQSK